MAAALKRNQLENNWQIIGEIKRGVKSTEAQEFSRENMWNRRISSSAKMGGKLKVRQFFWKPKKKVIFNYL